MNNTNTEVNENNELYGFEIIDNSSESSFEIIANNPNEIFECVIGDFAILVTDPKDLIGSDNFEFEQIIV
jgi:hypothetical protein